MSEYRIVRDDYRGFEVQVRRRWWPFWVQCFGLSGGSTNTHDSAEKAEQFARRHAAGDLRLVKYLGRLPSNG